MSTIDIILLSNGFNRSEFGYSNGRYSISIINNSLITEINGTVVQTNKIDDTMSLFNHINKISKFLQ